MSAKRVASHGRKKVQSSWWRNRLEVWLLNCQLLSYNRSLRILSTKICQFHFRIRGNSNNTKRTRLVYFNLFSVLNACCLFTWVKLCLRYIGMIIDDIIRYFLFGEKFHCSYKQKREKFVAQKRPRSFFRNGGR
mgnify:CR=1 FL=1